MMERERDGERMGMRKGERDGAERKTELERWRKSKKEGEMEQKHKRVEGKEFNGERRVRTRLK